MASDTHTARCPQCGQSFTSTVKMCPNDGTVLEHTAPSPTESQLGKVLDGKYRLDSFLSQGGMGAVFKATHVMLGKTVAVKLINQDLVASAEVVRRFQREARAATALNHPNIVSVYDLGQTPEGTLYIAMEFVDGPSLKSAIQNGGPVGPARAVALLRQVASALAVAHRAKIVHRDLKPHNIMLARQDGREVVKLVDFGIAKTFDESTQLTMDGDAIGTPHYMAPEQAEGRNVDTRSDLYSLGVIVYEMLTGQVPFNDSSTAAILVKHLREIPERPSLRNPGGRIPPELEAIALKCLEKDPAARFQSAEEFSAALEKAALAIPGADPAMQADATIRMPTASGAAAADEATMPMKATGSAPSPATAATVVAPVAAAAAAVRTERPAPPLPARPGRSDTRPTAVPPPGSPIPAAATASRSRSSNVGLVLGFVAVAVVLGAAGYYMNRQPAVDQAATAADTLAPAAVPAAAQQADATPPVPAEPPPPPAAAQAPAAGPQAAASAPAGTAPARTDGPAVTPRAPAPAAATAPRTVPSAPAAGVTGTTQPAPAARPQPAQAAAFPESPAVFFNCTGAAEICGPLRTAVADALDKAGMTSIRNAARADIEVDADAGVVDGKVTQQFGQTFAVRNYTVQFDGEAPQTGETVPMPSPASMSFDAQYGSERAAERSRVIAGDIVERVRAFVRKKRGG